MTINLTFKSIWCGVNLKIQFFSEWKRQKTCPSKNSSLSNGKMIIVSKTLSFPFF